MLGASSEYLGIDFTSLEQSIEAIFGRKGKEIVKMNIDALKAGKKEAPVQVKS